jgi:hypothetical protein
MIEDLVRNTRQVGTYLENKNKNFSELKVLREVTVKREIG